MKRRLPQMSFILSLVLILQLFLPVLSAFAAIELNAPANVKVYIYNVNDIHLTWNTVSGASTYRIYKVNQDQKELLFETGKNTWYKEKFPEGAYTLAVSAVSGNVESVLSAPVTVQIVYPEVKSPTNLAHTIYNGNDLLLYWQKTDFATSYNVYQIVDGKRELITTTSKTNHYLSQLPEGDYNYEITTVSDRFGESKTASPYTITMVHPEIKPPAGLMFSVLNGNDVLLSWQKAEYAKEYQIYRVVDGTRELVTTTTKTSHYFSQLPEGDYVYEVLTVSDRFGVSNEASQILLPLVHPVIQPPASLTYSIYNGNDVLIYWPKADFAKEYRVYQVVDGNRVLVATTSKTNQYFSQLPEGEFVYEVTTVSDRFGESKEVSQIVIPLNHPDIQPPSDLTHSIYNGNDALLSWKKADFAKKYNIYKVVDGNRELVVSTAETSHYFSQLSEGDYVYEVTTVSDRFSESEGASQTTVSIVYPEIKAPSITLQMQDRDAFLMSWDKVDFANFYNVYKIVDGKKVFVGKTTSNAYSGFGLADGTHEYVVTTVSNRFGESPYSNKVAAEVKPKLAAPPAIAPTVEGDDVTLSWGAVEGATSYNVYQEVDGEKVLVGTTTEPTLTISDLEAGNHEFNIVPVAESGVEGSESTKVSVITEVSDVTPPVTSSNAEDKWLHGVFNVLLTATDDKSGVAKTYYSVNGSDYVEGSSFVVSEAGVSTVSFYSVDNAGNEEEVKTVEVKIDEAPPVTTSNVTDKWLKESFLVKLTATDDLSGVEKTYYSVNGSEYVSGATVFVSDPGVNIVSFFSVDKAGNVETEVKTVEVKIDKTAPETVSNVIDQWNQGEVAVELTATDDLSGVAQTFYSINGTEFVEGTTFTVTEEGVNEVSFYSVDNAGNVEEVKTVKVKIDKTAPETVSNVIDQWNQGEVAVELTATDDLSGVAKTFYSINGTEFVEGTTFTVTEEGVNEVSFYSVDNAGNVEEVKTVKVKIDKTAPETVSNVIDQWNQGEVAVELTATDDLSGVVKTFYSINGSEFVEGTTFTVSEEGVNEVSFYSVDNAGNVEEVKTVEVKIDTEAPETVSNVTDQWNKGEVAVELTATDSLSEVAQTFYSINDSEFVEGTTFTVTEEGVNKVSFYSVDNAGNVEEVKTVEVKIDANAPETASNVSDQWNKGEVAVELTATDALSGVAKTFYSINGTEFMEGAAFTVTEEGVNEVSFYSVDNAGNVEEAKTVEVKIDKTAPTVSIPLASEQAQGSTFTVEYLAEDTFSGIAVEEVTLNGKTYKKGDQITLDEPGSYKLVVTVTDAAGWTTQVEKEFVVYMPATLEVLPKVIKGNNGVFTVKANLPAEYQSLSFDVSNVTLNGVAADPKNNGLQKQAEKGHFKFEREDFDWEKGEVTLELRGYLENGILVIAQKTVEVK